MPKMIDISDLPQPFASAVEALVNAYRRERGESLGASRPHGWLKDSWTVPDTFFDPLPSELVEDFEGGRAAKQP